MGVQLPHLKPGTLDAISCRIKNGAAHLTTEGALPRSAAIVVDGGHTWRIVYRIDPDAIVVGAVFDKKTQATPANVIERSTDRFQRYDDAAKKGTRK